MKKVFFDDLPINILTLDNVLVEIKKLLERKGKFPKTTVCLNANNVNLAYKDKEYRQIIKKADLVIPDGWGVVWAGKLLGYKLKERVTTADYFNDFCQMLVDNNYSCYFLGSQQKAINKAVKKLKEKFVKIKIIGYHSGFFNHKKEKKIIKEINKLKPDFLLLGMGTPKQEKWLFQNKDKLKVKISWGVGAIFDYLAGSKKRCPVLLGRLGVEWLFRLLYEPRRLWRRYILGSIEFIILCLKLSWKKNEK